MLRVEKSSLVFIVSLLFLILAGSAYGADIRLGAGISYKSFSGEFDLKPGMGMNITAGFPYSRNLELFAGFNLPFRYELDNSEGQIFSSGTYNKSYDKLSCFSLSAGFNLLGIFRDGQKLFPVAGLKFGKTWLGGSSKDVFSGINTDIAFGARYKINAKFTTQLLYNYSGINFDRLKIGGDGEDITGNVEESINSIVLSVIYHIPLISNDDLALSSQKINKQLKNTSVK